MYIFRRRRINVCNVPPCPNRFITRLYPKWPPAWPLWPFAHNPTYSEGRSLYCATRLKTFKYCNPVPSRQNTVQPIPQNFCDL